jgi:hypothetical protein
MDIRERILVEILTNGATAQAEVQKRFGNCDILEQVLRRDGLRQGRGCSFRRQQCCKAAGFGRSPSSVSSSHSRWSPARDRPDTGPENTASAR